MGARIGGVRGSMRDAPGVLEWGDKGWGVKF